MQRPRWLTGKPWLFAVACLTALTIVTVLHLLRPASASADVEDYIFRNVVIGGGGGFVPGIVFSTKQPGLVYVRTDIGGAYRWNPFTGRWIPLLDWLGPNDWNLTGVESIAIDPVNPWRLYLAAGTYTNEFTSQNGAILRSSDWGFTFQRFDLPFKVGANMPGRSMGERLAVDPNNPSILYLGARSGNGLWKSMDYGQTWSRVSNFPDSGPYFPGPQSNSYTADPIGVVWVTFDPNTRGRGGITQTIYVGAADLNTSIYRTTDGGQTWAAVPGQPTGFLPHHGKLANGTLYISYSNGAGPYDGTKGDVWKFDTAGGTWTRISPVPSTSSADYFGYGGLSVDAQNPNTLVVAALNSWWPDTILFRSLDGGSTWKQIWNWGTYPMIVPRYLLSYANIAPWLTFGGNPNPCSSLQNAPPPCPQPTPKLGWMVGSLEIDPFNSDHLLYGTGATIFGTSNLTAWDNGGNVQISVSAQGVEETAVQDLISPPVGPPLVSAVGDIGGFTHTDLKRPSVMDTNPVLTTTTSLDYAELSPSFMVRVGTGNNGGNNIGFSTTSGAQWFPAASAPAGAAGGFVAAAADASRVLWSPSGMGVFYTANSSGSEYGNAWTQSLVAPVNARIAADRVNPLKFYACAGGTFYLSIDGGVTFIPTPAANLPPTGNPIYFKAA
ncbi:MAG: xyloglucanase, partial [Acidobacteria bacterium]|nr:xyloglucanase [Acidobacteriota bacterium]